jgi:hypothetical protein
MLAVEQAFARPGDALRRGALHPGCVPVADSHDQYVPQLPGWPAVARLVSGLIRRLLAQAVHLARLARPVECMLAHVSEAVHSGTAPCKACHLVLDGEYGIWIFRPHTRKGDDPKWWPYGDGQVLQKVQ